MAKEKKESEKDKALKLLSDDNRKWLESWEKEGWEIVVGENLSWSAVKQFDDEEEACRLENYESLVVLLTVIEKEESKRKNFEPVETETDNDKIKVSEEVVVRHLRVELDDEAVKARTNAMIDTMNDLDDEENKFLSTKEQHKSIRKRYEGKVQRLRHAIHARFEFQDVVCKEVLDYEKFTVSIIRTDTNTIVDQRPMTETERQRALFKGAGK